MNPDLRHPRGYVFPAGPKAPAPIPHKPLALLKGTHREFNLPRAIAAALRERGDK